MPIIVERKRLPWYASSQSSLRHQYAHHAIEETPTRRHNPVESTRNDSSPTRTDQYTGPAPSMPAYGVPQAFFQQAPPPQFGLPAYQIAPGYQYQLGGGMPVGMSYQVYGPPPQAVYHTPSPYDPRAVAYTASAPFVAMSGYAPSELSQGPSVARSEPSGTKEKEEA